MIDDRNLKPGTALVGRYKGKEYRAKAIAGKDGKVRYRLADGREFKSPSGAGSTVMGGVACNGWKFWTPAVALRDTRSETRHDTKVRPRAKGQPAGKRNKKQS